MTRIRTGVRPDSGTFGEGQHGGERPEIEQGGRHGQPEKGDAVRDPKQGGSGYRTQPDEPRKRGFKKK